MPNQSQISGVILAGGLARRMNNQDKGLVPFQGEAMISHAIKAIQPVVDQLLINANRNLDQYQQFGFPVVSDETDTFEGPLAGVFSALKTIDNDDSFLLVTPCDSPLVCSYHLQKLVDPLMSEQKDIAVAHDGERLHPVFMVLKNSLADSLADYLKGGQRKIDLWIEQHDFITVDFSSEKHIFQNINTLSELEALEHGPTE